MPGPFLLPVPYLCFSSAFQPLAITFYSLSKHSIHLYLSIIYSLDCHSLGREVFLMRTKTIQMFLTGGNIQ